MADPTQLVSALEYGALGLAFVVVIAMITAGGWLLRRFTDQIIEQASKSAERADATVLSVQSIAAGAVEANVKSTAVLEKITGQLAEHDNHTSAAHVEMLKGLANIQGSLGKRDQKE